MHLFCLLSIVAEHFLQRGSIDVMRHTMSISPAKLVSEGPESLRPQQSPALPTSSESNTSGDIDELSDEFEKAGGDAKVKTETALEEAVSPEGEEGSKLSAMTADSNVLPATITSIVPDEQLSGTADRSHHNIHDIAAIPASSCSESAAENEATVKRCDMAVDQEESKREKQMENLNHNEVDDAQNEYTVVGQAESEQKEMENLNVEDMSSCQRTDDEQTYEMNQSATAKQTTDSDTAIELTNAQDAAARPDEFEHITDHTSTSDHTLDAANIVATQYAVVEPSVDVDMSIVDIDSETNEAAVSLSAGQPAITVLVSDIPRGLDETVEMYLESRKKGGGKILSFKYDRQSGSALVMFADSRGNFHLSVYRCLSFHQVVYYSL